MPITSKDLESNIVDTDLEDLLGEDEEETVEEEMEDEEEEVVARPVKKVKKVKSEKISVILNEATTYTIRGRTFRRNELVELPRSELRHFENNGWFTIRK